MTFQKLSMLPLNHLRLNPEATVEYLKANDTYQLDQRRQKDFTIQARGANALKVSLYKEDGGLYTVNDKPVSATGKNPRLTVSNLPSGTYYVQAIKAEDELVVDEIPTSGELHEGYSRKLRVRQTKFDPTIKYTAPNLDYLVFDMDGNRDNGWTNELNFATPGEASKGKRFTVYVETDDKTENLDGKQTKRGVYFFKNGFAKENFVSGFGVGAIQEQINTKSTVNGGYQFTFDYKCDMTNFWTNARRKTLIAAANKLSSVIRSDIPAGLVQVTLNATPYGVAHPVPTFNYREDVLVAVCSGDISPNGVASIFLSYNGTNTLVPAENGVESAVAGISIKKGWIPTNQATLEHITLHELSHAMGLLGKNSPGKPALVPDSVNPTAFAGVRSKAFNGGQNIPMSTVNPGHTADTIDSIMYQYTNDTRTNLTQLDLNLLADHGYLVRGIN